MSRLLLDDPGPDFDELVRVLKGEQQPQRVHLVEVGIDPEILQAIQESCLGEPWALPYGVHILEQPDERYYRQLVNLYYRLGYDFVPIWPFWLNNPAGKTRRTGDSDGELGGSRDWVDSSGALIKSRADYTSFPWESIRAAPETFEMVARFLPPGMKMTVISTLFENIFEFLLGNEGLFYLLHDDPQLVEDVFKRWGQIVFDFYSSVIKLDAVGGIFHVDDMGFNSGTLISPDDLRRLVLPWLKQYAGLAHAYNKPFFLHSCGNLYKKSPSVMEDLINVVGIDGFHSFQDSILPISDAKALYGNQVGLLGGIDMNKLASMPETELRVYLRGILEKCMPGGRYAFGSGNTIANYVPLQNFSILLEEARIWKA
jgi:uroporphyrinogen decarboxylase